MSVKNKTLAMLEAHRGEFFSGETLAELIGVSRNAVWKSIKQLEQEGYPIIAVKSKGYCLEETSDKLSLQGLLPFLDKNMDTTLIQVHDTIDSTNNLAKELAVSGAKHGTVVIANEQTNGRGRYGKVFESPKDTGIYMSLIIKPSHFPSIDPSLMTAYSAVVVSDVLSQLTGEAIGIKWVNDLFLNGKKVCGILTEAVTNLETGLLDWIVVGIGINVSTEPTDFSQSVQSVATSLVNDKRVTRNEIAAEIINQFFIRAQDIDQSTMMQSYRDKSIVLGKTVSVVSGTHHEIAHVEDILNNGSLLIKQMNGDVKEIRFGEVSLKIN